MGVDILIGILQKFKDGNPNSVVDSIVVMDGTTDCARLHWYNDNDDGHVDFYF